MRSLSLLALLALALGSVQAQTVVLRPGHPDLMTAGLTLGTQVQSVRIAEPAQDIGTMAYRVSRDGDTVTLVTASDAPMANRTGETTTTFAWPSLRPIRRERVTEAVTSRTTYDGRHVTGVYGRGEWAPLAFDITLDAMPFQPEVMPLVARALPLRAGYTATLPTFDASQRLREVTMTVVGEETFVRADGSETPVWTVEQTSTGRGAETLRYAVDGQTRELVGISLNARPGTMVVMETTTQEAIDAIEARRARIGALRPGSDALAVDALQSYSQDFVVKLVQPQQQDIGTMTRTLTVDRTAGTVTLEERTEIALAGQKSRSTMVMAYPSLRPISARSDNNGAIAERTYGDRTVTRTPADGEAEETTFEEPAFDPSALFEVVRLLPFAEDYQTTYRTFGADGETGVTLSVTGQEEIGGTTAWIVRAQPEDGPATDFAVADATRELLRVSIQPQVGVLVQIVPAD